MKTLIMSVTLLFSSGLVFAESNMSMHKKDSAGQQEKSHTQQRTAQQPGIGDSTKRFEKKASVDFFDRDDWSIITEEDIYGSF